MQTCLTSVAQDSALLQTCLTALPRTCAHLHWCEIVILRGSAEGLARLKNFYYINATKRLQHEKLID